MAAAMTATTAMAGCAVSRLCAGSARVQGRAGRER
jgi:hypothetical protein